MTKKTKKRIITWSCIGVVLWAVILFFAIGKPKKAPVHLETEKVHPEEIEITVTATGEIQPVYKVEVGTQVSGIVEKLYVDYNSHVKKGQLLAELDRSTLQEQVKTAQASVSNAESSLTLAKQNYDRVKTLHENKAATDAEYEEVCNQYTQAKNMVTTAKSELQRAQVNLSYSQIYSPIDGIVLSKSVEEGQTVASSFSTPTIFTLANNLKQMQVEAKVDEADIGKVDTGQNVTFTVDAYPDDIFTGTVRQIRLEPTVTSNVVTYTVIIDAPNPEEKLMPGMTANVSIIVEKESGLAIPMEALYLKLDPSTQEKLAKEGYIFKSMFNNQEEETNSLKDITRKTIWIIDGKTCQQVQVKPGINDGTTSLILEGIKATDEVIVSAKEMTFGPPPGADKKKSFMPGPPERKKR